MTRLVLPAALGLLLLAGCATAPKTPKADLTPPPLPREFRAVWVATVNNIDWPSKRSLSAAEQRAEMNAILDRARALNPLPQAGWPTFSSPPSLPTFSPGVASSGLASP